MRGYQTPEGEAGVVPWLRGSLSREGRRKEMAREGREARGARGQGPPLAMGLAQKPGPPAHLTASFLLPHPQQRP